MQKTQDRRLTLLAMVGSQALAATGALCTNTTVCPAATHRCLNGVCMVRQEKGGTCLQGHVPRSASWLETTPEEAPGADSVTRPLLFCMQQLCPTTGVCNSTCACPLTKPTCFNGLCTLLKVRVHYSSCCQLTSALSNDIPFHTCIGVSNGGRTANSCCACCHAGDMRARRLLHQLQLPRAVR